MIGATILLSTGLLTFGSLSLVNYSERLEMTQLRVLWLTLAACLGLGIVSHGTDIWSIALVPLLLAISITDLKTQMLPDWLMVLLIMIGLAQGGFAFPSFIGTALCVLCALANATVTRDDGMIGSADYLLCAGLVAWLGPLYAIDAFIIALVCFGLQILITGRRIAAFAPAASIGLSAIWFGGPIL